MSVNVYANSAFGAANSASSYANSGFSTANTANSIVNSKVTINSLNFLSAPSPNTAQTIFLVVDLDNSQQITKKMSLSVLTERSANAAFTAANSAASYANSAFAAANTGAGAVTAGSYANSGFVVANSAASYANSAFAAANTGAGAVTAGSYANSAFITANTPSHVANSAASYANSAFGAANSAAGAASASSYANSAFLVANTPTHVANSAASYANSAYTRANNSINANTGGSIIGDISITGNLTVTGNTTYTNTRTVLIADNIITVNAAIDQAAQPAVNAGIEVDRGAQPNSSFLWIETSGKWAANNGNASIFIAADSAESYANAAFTAANAAFTAANAATATDATQNASIAAAFTQANSVYLPSVTRLDVTHSSSSAYLIDQYTGDNPNIFIRAGETLAFNLAVTNHPFLIRVSNGGSNYSNGLTHVTTTGTVTTESSAQGQVTGRLYWKVPAELAGNTYVYQCSNHAGMVGNIVIERPNQANSAASYANAAFAAANTGSGAAAASSYANSAFLTANTPSHVANSAASYANAAFAAANTGSGAAAASSYANSAFLVANNSLGIDTTQNTNITNTGTYANSAYVRANNSLNANTGGTIEADVTISSNLTAGNLIISTGGTITGNAAAGGSVSNTVGYMGIPQNNLTTNYVVTLADQGKHLYYNVATNSTVFIPLNSTVAFPVGATIAIISRTSSSANVTITPNTGVSLFLAGNTTSAGRNVTTYGMATLVHVSANTWFVNGTGVSAL